MLAPDHTRTAYDTELHGLSFLLTEMGGVAETQVMGVATALQNGDRNRAVQLIEADLLIDRFQTRVEESAVKIIACHQPVANDLRRVIATLRAANELERIGDLAKNIAKRVSQIGTEQMPRQVTGGIRHMAGLILSQLCNALDSFANHDDKKAFDVWARDREVDSLHHSLFRELLTYMLEDQKMITLGVHLAFSAKNMERIGDHAINIADAVYYMVRGETLWAGQASALYGVRLAYDTKTASPVSDKTMYGQTDWSG
jgi:phosphate transport system protein